MADHPGWRLRICGSGKQRRALEVRIQEKGLGGAVELAGAVDDIGEAMERASIFVLSSRWEGFPLVLLEAMSKGLAVVAADCPTGPAEIVEDGRNGLLVPARRVNGLAGGIRALIEDEALRRRCAAGALETAAQYSMDAVGDRWDALLRDLGAGRPFYDRSP